MTYKPGRFQTAKGFRLIWGCSCSSSVALSGWMSVGLEIKRDEIPFSVSILRKDVLSDPKLQPPKK
jgi:hypothetical protein